MHTDWKVARTNRARWLEVVTGSLAFLVLPNLPYALWLSGLTPTRAIINVDYIVLGIISPLLPSIIVVAAFSCIAIVDAFVFVSVLYHFNPHELAMSFGYARYSPVTLSDLPLARIAATLIVLTSAVYLAVRARSKSWVNTVYLSVILVVVITADVSNGTNTYAPFTHLPFYTRTQLIAGNLANSGVLAADLTSFLPTGRAPVVSKAPSATQIALDVWRDLSGHERGSINVALVLVESWGQIDGQEGLTRAIAAPLMVLAISERYDVRIGSVAFHGSTTNAELRELCGLQMGYRDIFNLPRLNCLPDQFARKGYRTIGMHGFHGDMFDRTSWWPQLGIHQSLFLDDFRKAGFGRSCGTAFPGLCDDDLVGAMGNKLISPRQFIYALTINSHLPLPPVKDGIDGFHCSALPVPLHDAPCALAHQWHNVFAATARTALRTDIKPTQFIVVGDHSPPLLGTSDQGFSQKYVPYVLLTPKATN